MGREEMLQGEQWEEEGGMEGLKGTAGLGGDCVQRQAQGTSKCWRPRGRSAPFHPGVEVFPELPNTEEGHVRPSQEQRPTHRLRSNKQML